MDAVIAFLVLIQGLGAIVGVVTAVWGELSYLKAARDGKIDAAERLHLAHIARGLRFGMTLVLFASFALVIAAYVSSAVPQPALTEQYWTLMVLAFLIIYAVWALSRQRIAFALGSAIAFTAWWFLAYLIFGWIPAMSFGATVAFFIIATGVFYGVLQYARFLATPSR